MTCIQFSLSYPCFCLKPGNTEELVIFVKLLWSMDFFVICKKSKVLIKHDHGIDWSCENYFTRTPKLMNIHVLNFA